MRYRNKVDWWIALIIISVVFMYIPILFLMPPNQRYIMWIIMGCTALMVVPFLFGYVELRDDVLYVRVGFFHEKIRYDNIKSIRLATNFLNSMATTTKRIEIVQHKKSYFARTTYIGPVDRELVFDELKHLCHHLEQQ